MSVEPGTADVVLAGGGMKGIGHVGALAALERAGCSFARVAGTSAGSIVGALLAAGMPTARMSEVMHDLQWSRLRDGARLDRVPLAGPALSVLLANGVYEGAYLREWLGNQLADLGVETFADLRLHDDAGSALDGDEQFKLVVMAADVTRGELVRLPWDLRDRYGLDPDEQLVVDAVRASMSIPLFYEPVRLRAADGATSTLVDGGLLSNFPIDVFDRTDGRPPRWPTFGVTLLPPLPAGNVQLFPWLGLLDRGLLHFLESVVTTTVVGRDQGHLARPWVAARTIAVDTAAAGVVDFELPPDARAALFDNGVAAAERFLAGWDWPRYLERFRGGAPAEARA
jgi:NTE family protein